MCGSILSICYYDIEGQTYYTGVARDITSKLLIHYNHWEVPNKVHLFFTLKTNI
ncbi:hypothetical protein KQC08_03340 [Leptospira sp. Pond_2020]|nr:hypothetical protein [Leptospira sp. Pond_2020]